MDRFVDARLVGLDRKLDEIEALRRENQVYDLASKEKIPFSILRRIHEILTRAGIKPVKGKKTNPKAEFLAALAAVDVSVENQGGQLVMKLEKGQGQNTETVTVRGSLQLYYAAYIRFEENISRKPKK